MVYDILMHLVTGQWAWFTISNGNVIGYWEITDWYGPVHTLALFLAAVLALHS